MYLAINDWLQTEHEFISRINMCEKINDIAWSAKLTSAEMPMQYCKTGNIDARFTLAVPVVW